MQDQTEGLLQLVSPVQIRIRVFDQLDLFCLVLRAVFGIAAKCVPGFLDILCPGGQQVDLLLVLRGKGTFPRPALLFCGLRSLRQHLPELFQPGKELTLTPAWPAGLFGVRGKLFLHRSDQAEDLPPQGVTGLLFPDLLLPELFPSVLVFALCLAGCGSPDEIEFFIRPFSDMEEIDTAGGIREVLFHTPVDPLGAVAGNDLDP